MSQSTGGLGSGRPSASRDKIEARSKPEAIDVHLFDPVAETIDDHAADDGMIGVKRVAAAAVVGVLGAASFEDVVGRVVDAAKGKGGTAVVALGGVIEDDVENDFNAGAMKCLYHVAKFVDGTEGRFAASCSPDAGRR